MNKKALILLTDDEPNLLEIYKFVLQREGWDVLTSTNGQDCIDQARDHSPNLILLDLKMPVMDGIETYKKLMEDEKTKGIKVVFLSVYADPQEAKDHIDEETLKDISHVPFIRKGMELEDFAEKIRVHL